MEPAAFMSASNAVHTMACRNAHVRVAVITVEQCYRAAAEPQARELVAAV